MFALRFLVAALIAVPAGPIVGAPPALTVVIAVDGLSKSLFDRYRPHFAGGFARLAGGASFTLAGSGDPILGNSPSLAATLKQGRPGSQSLIVSGSPALSAALADPSADQRWGFNAGRFEALGGAPVPAIAPQANAAISKAVGTAQPPLESPPECAGPPLASGGKRFGRAAGDLAGYVASPQMDGGTLAFALAMARELGLGSTSSRADVVAIGLGATAAVASAHGEASQEMCLNLLSLDRDLGDAFTYLDRSGIDYAVVLAGRGTEAPLLFWRKDWLARANSTRAQAADIVPTIAAMLGAPMLPADGGGACLSGIPGVVCPTR